MEIDVVNRRADNDRRAIVFPLALLVGSGYTRPPSLALLADQHTGQQSERGVLPVKTQTPQGGRWRRGRAPSGVQPAPFLKKRQTPVRKVVSVEIRSLRPRLRIQPQGKGGIDDQTLRDRKISCCSTDRLDDRRGAITPLALEITHRGEALKGIQCQRGVRDSVGSQPNSRAQALQGGLDTGCGYTGIASFIVDTFDDSRPSLLA